MQINNPVHSKFSGIKAPQTIKNVGYSIVIATLIGSPIAVMNHTPDNTVAVARKKILGFIPSPWPEAYLRNNGDVISPFFRVSKGHIFENGEAKNIAGFAKGKGDAEGKAYEYTLPVEGAALLPEATVNSEGTVRKWPWSVPIGAIKTLGSDTLSMLKKSALALWLIEDGSSDDDKKSNSPKK